MFFLDDNNMGILAGILGDNVIILNRTSPYEGYYMAGLIKNGKFRRYSGYMSSNLPVDYSRQVSLYIDFV